MDIPDDAPPPSTHGDQVADRGTTEASAIRPNLSRPELWAIVADHEFSDDQTGRRFVTGLMTDLRLPPDIAEQAIREYRRFLYLVALGDGRRVPSRAVDCVWQKHLGSHAEDWSDLCRRIGRPIRRIPGRESDSADDAVRATRAAYLREFGESMPEGLWRYPNRTMQRVAAILGLSAAVVVALAVTTEAPPGLAIVLGLGALMLLGYGAPALGEWLGIPLRLDFEDNWGKRTPGDVGGVLDDGAGDGGGD